MLLLLQGALLHTQSLLQLTPLNMPAPQGTLASGNSKRQQLLLREFIMPHEHCPTMAFLSWLWNTINEWKGHQQPIFSPCRIQQQWTSDSLPPGLLYF